MNNRRKLVIALGASALAAPLRIYAQPVKRSVVEGILATRRVPWFLRASSLQVLKISAKILPLEARTAPDLENAFSAMTQGKAGAVIVARDGFFVSQWRQIADLALKNRLPSISEQAEYAAAGGLMSYGVNLAEQFRRAAVYVDKILRGAKPGELPVEQPAKFELVINGKTMKALRLSIPQSVQISVDKVPE